MLVNLCNHAISVHLSNGKVVEIPPSGLVARATVKHLPFMDEAYAGEEIPINRQVYTAIDGLPPKETGVWYIVSEMAGEAAAQMGRTDVLVTNERIKVNSGKVVGCRSLRLAGL
jgi:hypothetical protein